MSESMNPTKLQQLKERYPLTAYQPYADALARVRAIKEKQAECNPSLAPLRAEFDQLDQAARQAESDAFDAKAGVLLGTVSESDADAAQKRAKAARAKAETVSKRLQEAENERGMEVYQRAVTMAEAELRSCAQAAKEFLRPQIRAEHEAVIQRAAIAFRELSAALAAEQEIRDAVELGPVRELKGLGLMTLGSTGNDIGNIRQFIHVELGAVKLDELEDLIRLDRYKWGQWIAGYRQAGYPVD